MHRGRSSQQTKAVPRECSASECPPSVPLGRERQAAHADIVRLVRSVADQIAAERRASERASTPSERIELALRLGEDAVEMFCAAQQLDEASARAGLTARRQRGRRPSACARAVGS